MPRFTEDQVNELRGQLANPCFCYIVANGQPVRHAPCKPDDPYQNPMVGKPVRFTRLAAMRLLDSFPNAQLVETEPHYYAGRWQW